MDDLKRGKALPQADSADAAQSAHTAQSENVRTADEQSADQPKLSGKEYAQASRRVSAIERKLEKIEQQKGELESQMNAHDPTDYEGLGKLSAQIAELETQQASWRPSGSICPSNSASEYACGRGLSPKSNTLRL